MKMLNKKAALIAAVMVAGSALFAQESEKTDVTFNGAQEYLHFGLNDSVSFFNGSADTKIISIGIISAGDKNILGYQGSIFYSHVEDASAGYQTSGGVSVAGDSFYGVQYSGIANIAGDVAGAQVSTFFNKAKTVRGLQFGFVNISDDTSATFGLINIVKNGVHDFGIGYDSNKNLYFQIQEGGRNLFTNIGAAGKLQGDFFYGEYCEAWAGLGSRKTWGRFSMDLEFLWKFVFSKETSDLIDMAEDEEDDDRAEEILKDLKHFQVPHLRLSANVEIVKHVALFGAFGVDLRVEDFNDQAFIHQKHNLSGSFKADDRKVTMYPTFSAGIKIK